MKESKDESVYGQTTASELKQEKKKSFWTRYAVWVLVPIILALYYSHDKAVLAELKQTERQVLPSFVKPVHYDLNLTPDLETFVYKGVAKIDLDIQNETSVIVLNAIDMTFNSVKIIVNDESYPAIDIKFDNKTEQVDIQFDKVLPKNSKAKLEINFEGTLNDHMSGFYRSSYKNEDGVTKYLATTQFEATDARRAFPCWDEPSLKATFDVTLNVPSNLTALSNMDVIVENSWSKDIKTLKYATTPRMSTYLVAFIVGPFEYIEKYTSGEHNRKPIRTRIYTLPGLSANGHHALNVATETLEYFAKVFDLPYPLPKLDLVAIPDFDAGAMENWGLVTFRTTAILYDEKNSAVTSRRNTAYTVAHELAHQWFGNLVTMEWWDHLWLNEGFATWVGWLAIDHIFPEWDIWTMFATQSLQEALALDGLRSSHPIQVAVNNPSEIHQIFDDISYLKGASVIRMVNSWLGTDTFLLGIQKYLKAHRLSNAATSDLWSALSQAAGKNVSEFMNTWTEETGYPIINVSQHNKDTVRVTQSRYLLTGDLHEDEDSIEWWVPLRAQTPDGILDITLKSKSMTFEHPDNVPIKLNQGQSSLYRVNYDQTFLDRLIIDLKSKDFGILSSPRDRAGVISDLGVLSRSGEQSTVTLLDFIKALKNENNYFVLNEASNRLNGLISLWEDYSEIEPQLQNLRSELYSPLVKELGWEPKSEKKRRFSMTTVAEDSDLTKQLRVLAINEAGLAGNTEIITEAKRRYQQFIQGNHEAVSPHLRSSVFKIVLKYAQHEEEEDRVWQEIFGIYNNEDFPIDQRIIALHTLGYGVKSKRVIQKTLDLTLDQERVKSQDAWIPIKSLSTNYHARSVLIDFFEDHYDIIYERFSKSMSALGNSVSNIVSGVNNMEQIEQFEEFFKTKDTKDYRRGLSGGLEKARVNVAQIEREYKDVAKWAENQDNVVPSQ